MIQKLEPSSNPMRTGKWQQKCGSGENVRCQLEREKTNVSILSELDVKNELLGNIMNLNLAYFGQIMRGSGSPLTMQIVERMVKGKKETGRQKKKKNNGLTTSESGED